MKPNKISMNATIAEVETLLEKEKNISPALKAAIKILIVLITMFDKRLGLNSENSSKSPAEDKNRNRGSNRKKSDKKPGGQNGHVGTKLMKVSDPDRIEEIKVDRRYLPKGQYQDVGYESRQVFDIEFSRVITEYRAQILEDQSGARFIADFPQGVKSTVQYGSEVKVNSVYMSQFQLLPYNRIQDQFADQMNLPLSTGTIFNFNQEAYELLEQFDAIVKKQLTESQLAHADETGINVNKKRIWLHSVSNEKWTHFYPHQKRGREAMDEIGIISKFKGVLCHDHWKPYYKYSCLHALCNAHHIRELTCAEEDHQQWATLMKSLLLEMNKAVDEADGKLSLEAAAIYRNKYREILKKANETECPPAASKEKGQRGQAKKSKSRNLLERLRDFENDTLRFLDVSYVPFTNNQGENDIRMTKVQQKISGCFRSIEGAYIFCRIRGYLSTCRKNNVGATEALRILFGGKLPGFVCDLINSS
jgi:Transposase IS66 family.